MADAPKRLSDLSIGRGELLKLDPRTIVIEPGFNARDFNSPENKEHVETLKLSIIAQGVLEPLTVRYKEGTAILVNGESRLRATLAAINEGHDIKTVPAIGEPTKGYSEADRIASLITRNTGKSLTPLEASGVCVRLLKHGWNETQIAAKVGLSQPYVSQLIKLAEVPADIQAAVTRGEISATHVVSMVREQGENAPEIIRTQLTQAAATGKSVKPKAGKKAAAKDPKYKFTQEDGKAMVGALREIFASTTHQDRKVRQIIRNVLESIGLDVKAPEEGK